MVPRGTRRPHASTLGTRARCSTWNREPQNRGRLAGMPSRRGYASGHGGVCSRTWMPGVLAWRAHGEAEPGQRRRPASGPSSGGSLTTSRPPTRSRGAAHSAVTAGDPKPGPPRRRRSPAAAPRPTTSARPSHDRTRSAEPERRPQPCAGTRHRRGAGVDQHQLQVRAGEGHGQPRHPAPLPRSTTRPATPTRAAMKPAAWTTWSPTGPGPRKPSCRARSSWCSRAGSGRRSPPASHAGRITTRRRLSSPSETVVTPSISFTVSWTTLRSGGLIGSSAFRTPLALHLLGDLLGEAGQGLPAPLPVPADVDRGRGRGPRRASGAAARCGTAPGWPGASGPSGRSAARGPRR